MVLASLSIFLNDEAVGSLDPCLRERERERERKKNNKNNKIIEINFFFLHKTSKIYIIFTYLNK